MAFNKLNVVIGANIESLQKELAKVEKSLQRFGRKMQQIGTDLTQTLTVPIAGLGAASLKAFSDIERLEKGLIALMGSSEAAKAEMVKLREVAKLPGLGFEEAIKGSVSLQAVGFSADKARETLLAFGKAVAVSGGTREDFNEVIYQLAQMNSKGKILAEDFKVLQSRIPILGTLLQDAFGTRNIAQIRDSGVGAAEFTQRIIDAANKSQVLSNVTGGLGNAFENFKDSAKIAFATLGQSLATAFDAQGFLDRLANAIQMAVDAFSRLSPATQKFIAFAGLAVAAVGPLVLIIGKLVSLGSLFTTGLDAIGVGFKALISPVGLVVVGIAALAAGLVYAYRNSEQFRNFIDRLVAATQVAFKAISNAAGVLFESFKTSIGGTIEIFKVFASVGKSALTSVYPYIKPLVDAVVQFGAAVFKYGIEYAKFLAAAYVGAFNSIIKGFTEVFVVIREKAAAIGKGITEILNGNFEKGFATLTTNTDGNFFNTAKRIGTAFTDGFKDGFQGTYKVFDDIADAYIKGAEKAKAAQKTNPVSFVAPVTPSGITTTAKAKTGGVGSQATAAIDETRGALVGQIDLLPRYAKLADIAALSVQSLADSSLNLKLNQDSLNVGVQTLSPSLEAFKSQVESLGLAYDAVGERAIPNVTASIIEGINAFGQYAKDGIKSFKDLGKAALASAAVIIKSLIQTGVAAAISNAFKNPLGVIPPLGAALATAAGLAASGLFSSLIGKIGIPKLAGGGIAYGNSIVNVGEYPGARTNPEVIAPLDKLKKIIGGGGNGGFIAETVISGSDLRVILSRADKTYTRYTTG
jgi:tape measure domain-containing protein